MRVLLTDGSGLTARQTAGLLSRAGHEVQVLSADPWCLCRWTRHVQAVRTVPGYGDDPLGWLDAAIAAYRDGRFDVLLPTQEQVAVLAAFPARLRAEGVATVVPTFAALTAVQDKVSAWRTLTRVNLPQPVSAVGVTGWDRFPAFVKQPVGTASGGVRRVTGPGGLVRAGDADVVLVQEAVEGPLAMCQAVVGHGRLMAFHAALRVAEGAGGGASHKRSVALPEVRDLMERLGSALGWHGALAADVILTSGGPLIIDVNPRLVEPVNAARAGVDLVGPLLDLAVGGRAGLGAAGAPAGRPGTATHQLLLAVLGAAAHGAGRRGVVGELVGAMRHTGAYRGSSEELTPLAGDPRSVVPLLVAAGSTLARPVRGSGLAAGSVANYALSPAGWDLIRRAAEPFTAEPSAASPSAPGVPEAGAAPDPGDPR